MLQQQKHSHVIDAPQLLLFSPLFIIIRIKNTAYRNMSLILFVWLIVSKSPCDNCLDGRERVVVHPQ